MQRTAISFVVTAQDENFVGEGAAIAFKMQSPGAELNVRLSLKEADSIVAGVPVGETVHALRAGTAAGAQVHWKLGDQAYLFIVVGDDDVTWDIGFTLSPEESAELFRELRVAIANSRMRPND